MILAMKKKSFHQMETPLGSMIAIADDQALYSLEFADTGRGKYLSEATRGITGIHRSIERELRLYFEGKLRVFETPIVLSGTEFQENVWRSLMGIAYGQTCSYTQIATQVGVPKGCRAAAGANGANRHVIMVPCHRVIYASGKLGGYSAGLNRKEYLLAHEKNFVAR